VRSPVQIRAPRLPLTDQGPGPRPKRLSQRRRRRSRGRSSSLRVHVDPANPGARVALQLKLRERFGWWTIARARLDQRSDARFVNSRKKRVWARVVLTQSDGWTILAASRAVRLRPRR
jgi:hypothetical protein